MTALALVAAGHVAAGLLLRALTPARRARALAWVLVLAGLSATVAAVGEAPAPWRFLAIVASLFHSLKTLTHACWRAGGAAPLPRGAWLAYALLWIGMNPAPFAPRARRRPRAAGRAVAAAALALAAAGLLWAGLAAAWQAGAPAFLVHLLQLVGVYLALRWGAFPLAAAVLARRGVRVSPPFRRPESATSLAAFWSGRWNRPFSEMLQLIVERPLRARSGRTGARAAGFVLSALLHEASLSLPARGGWGLPSAYFLLQLLLVTLEARLGVPRRLGARGARVLTLGLAALPAILVFHPPFLAAVMAPLLGPRG